MNLNQYEELLQEAAANGLIAKEKPLRSADGRIKGKRIAIRKDINTTKEKACVLAEELGHYYTTAGDIVRLDCPQDRKKERKARIWAYNRKIGLNGLIRAYENGCQSSSEVAEYLDVPESFLQEAIECYTNKYGNYASVDNYIIYFVPYLSICKMI